MPQASFVDFLIFGASGIFGRYRRCSFKPFLNCERRTSFRFVGGGSIKRELAIQVAFAQFLIAFIVSYFIYDYLYYLFSPEQQYIVPIAMTALGILYLYILVSLPYKITPKRCTFSIVMFLLATIIFIGISRSGPTSASVFFL
jgi:hypothetical protein